MRAMVEVKCKVCSGVVCSATTQADKTQSRNNMRLLWFPGSCCFSGSPSLEVMGKMALRRIILHSRAAEQLI